MVNVLIFFAVVALCFVIGLKTKTNFGIIAIAASFILGFTVLNMSAYEIMMLFPTSMFFSVFLATLFYGFAAENGALDGVAKRIVYIFRNVSWLMPIVCFWSCFLICSLGAGAVATPMIMSPIVFSIVLDMGLEPVIGAMAVFFGTLAGTRVVWASDYAQNFGLFQSVGFTDDVISAALNMQMVWGILLYFIVFVLICVFFKGLKIKNTKSLDIQKPEPFTLAQKKSLFVIVTVILLIMIPAVIQIFAPNPITGWMVANLSIRTLSAIGAALLAIMKVADTDKVINTKVPWGLLIMICGMSMLMSLATQMGVIDALSGLLKISMPAGILLALLLIILGVLSYFVAAATFMSLILPLLPVIVNATGLPAGAVLNVFMFGLNVTACSPFSMGGAMAICGCPDGEAKDRCVKKQMFVPWMVLVIFTVFTLLNIFSIGVI